MELHEALAQISEIRGQIARTETFRGYRSLTVGFSGALALIAAALQTVLIPNPTAQIGDYLTLWISVAVIAVLTAAAELTVRCLRASSRLTLQLTSLAVQQFVPCLVAGGLLTYVMVLFAAESLWMLPGLWAILFSLGVFASCRLLPWQTIWVGAYYMGSGIGCLVLAREELSLTPWAMVGTFGIGQLLTATVLYFTLERNREQS